MSRVFPDQTGALDAWANTHVKDYHGPSSARK